jgi:hypothetical protein
VLKIQLVIEPIKEFKPTCRISDFARKLRGRVIDLVGTDLLPDVIAIEREALKPVPASAYKHLDLVQVNSCTWKVVGKSKTDVPAKLGHWGGYRTTKALAWVINLGYGQWIARCGNEVCNPTNLAEAKRQALAMAVGGIGDYQVSDPIRELQELSVIMEDRYAEEFQVSTPKLAVVERSPEYVHDVQLEYYEDGYPKLPECLDRRITLLAKVA